MKSELRLAVAMRGGVSLAVWIGGALSEIDLVRRCGTAADGDFWAQMLELSEHDRVVVDVLAGASAGGLNGVLYAASQVYGFPYDAMRKIWLEVGGTEGLVRRDGPWPSLFLGDAYFLDKVHKNLDALASGPAPASSTAPGRIDLAVSATVIEPVTRPLPSPEDERLVERRHASGFRFRKPEEPWLPTDFPAVGDDGFAAALWRLAVAARSTSSYPAAFEAAEVRSGRPQSFAPPGGPAGEPGPAVDMDGTFLDRSTGGSFVVADGGILDNIPIGCALDYVASAPAAGPTRRVLMYLQPGAPSGPAPTAFDPGAGGAQDGDERSLKRRSTVAVVRGVLGARVAGETINADIAALEAYNEAVGLAATLRAATFAGLDGRPAFLAAAGQARAGYRLTRAAAEAKAVVALLDDPTQALGEDPFPGAVAGNPVGDEAWRSPVASWPAAIRQDLDARLSATTLAALDAPPGGNLLTCTGDAGPLLRVTALLIEWARAVEPTCTEAGRVKGELYAVRAFLGELDRARRLAWVAAATQAGEGCARFAAVAPEALRRLTRVERAVADGVVEALSGAAGAGQRAAVLAAARHGALARIDEVVANSVRMLAGGALPAPDPGSDDLLERIAERLLAIVQPLAGAPAPASGSDLRPGDLLHRALGAPGRPPPPVPVEVLEALDVLCLGEFLSGKPGRRGIDFRRISSANRTPLAREFHALLAEAGRLGLWWDPAVSPSEQQGIHVMLKLAGNELANFSAFLLAHWRANDWMWGRLDAVPTMVDLLVEPNRLGRRLAAARDRGEDAVEVVHRLVVPAGHPWQAALDEVVWTDGTAKEVAAEVADMLRAAKDERHRVPIPAIRSALVARRQWEVLRHEYRLATDPMGQPPGRDPDRDPGFAEVRAWVHGYAVGAETLRGNPRAPELLDRFEEISRAATEAVVWNAPLTRSPERSFTPFTLNLVRRVGPKLGRMAARRLVLEDGGGRSSSAKGAAALAAAVLVVLGVLGWFIDKWAFLLGFAVSFLPLAVLGWLGWRFLRRAVREEPDPGPGQPSSSPSGLSSSPSSSSPTSS